MQGKIVQIHLCSCFRKGVFSLCFYSLITEDEKAAAHINYHKMCDYDCGGRVWEQLDIKWDAYLYHKYSILLLEYKPKERKFNLSWKTADKPGKSVGKCHQRHNLCWSGRLINWPFNTLMCLFALQCKHDFILFFQFLHYWRCSVLYQNIMAGIVCLSTIKSIFISSCLPLRCTFDHPNMQINESKKSALSNRPYVIICILHASKL